MASLPIAFGGIIDKIESAPDIVARIAMPGATFLSVNQDCFGYKRDEIVRMSVQEFQDTCLAEESREVLRRECERVQFEKTRSHWFRIIAKHPAKKHQFHYDTLLIPVFEDGNLTEIQAVLREVTERVRLETRLVDIEKMESLGRLAGCIAHDFNNLLVGIMGSTSLALKKMEPAHPARPLLNTISNCADRGAELTKQLLSLTRQQSTLRESHDAVSAIESVMDILRRTIPKTIDIQWTQPMAPVWVEMVRADFERILLNLALNARDSMTQGGLLKISLRTTYRSGVVSSDSPSRSIPYALMEVSDTGEGMDAETQKHIFEPFFTTKGIGKGTGLGLASCYTLVKNMNGFIEFHSVVQHGTTFRVYLPLCRPAAPKPEPPAALEIPKSAGEGVLLVDDEQYILEAARAMLESAGFRCFPALHAEEAQEVLQAQLKTIDLAVLDLTMPKISGARLAKILKQLKPELKILVSSGYNLEGELSAEELIYIDGTLQKPYRMEELLRAVHAVMKRTSV
jgi:PAS domain S-box-containing protein